MMLAIKIIIVHHIDKNPYPFCDREIYPPVLEQHDFRVA